MDGARARDDEQAGVLAGQDALHLVPPFGDGLGHRGREWQSALELLRRSERFYRFDMQVANGTRHDAIPFLYSDDAEGGKNERGA